MFQNGSLRLGSMVSGVAPSYFPISQNKLQPGSRNISVTDMENHTRVVVLGDRIAQMGGVDIGDHIKINGIPCVNIIPTIIYKEIKLS